MTIVNVFFFNLAILLTLCLDSPNGKLIVKKQRENNYYKKGRDSLQRQSLSSTVHGHSSSNNDGDASNTFHISLSFSFPILDSTLRHTHTHAEKKAFQFVR